MSDKNKTLLIKKDYSIPFDIFEEAFRDFQKKFVFPKNILMSAVFALIAVSYTLSFLEQPDNSVCILIILACIGLICGMWLNAFMIRKKLMKSIKGIENDRYIIELFEDRLCIATMDQDTDNSAEKTVETEIKDSQIQDDDFFKETDDDSPVKIPQTELNFIYDNIKILEKNKFFIVYDVKRMFYVIPKTDFNKEELRILTETFSKGKFIPFKSEK